MVLGMSWSSSEAMFSQLQSSHYVADDYSSMGKIPSFPIHFTHLKLLERVGNLLGRFIKIDGERLSQLIFTNVRIYVEVYLHKSLLDKIEI